MTGAYGGHTMVVGIEHQRRERMTVSVSRDTRAFVRARAAELGSDQSAVVEDAIKRLRLEERRILTRQALLESAEFDVALAEAFMRGDTTLDEYPWEE